jgi:hypothetical protein
VRSEIITMVKPCKKNEHNKNTGKGIIIRIEKKETYGMTQKQFSHIQRDIKIRRTVGRQKRHQPTENRNDAKKNQNK